jgi:hypothetical protein
VEFSSTILVCLPDVRRFLATISRSSRWAATRMPLGRARLNIGGRILVKTIGDRDIPNGSTRNWKR